MITQLQTIRRQYDDVIAPHYDLDPQSVIGPSLERAAAQIHAASLLGNGQGPLRVLDLGVGSGTFLARLKALGGDDVQSFGMDLSEKMIDIARAKIPGLVARVGDVADFDAHFPGQWFDLVCTHFVTGYVPMRRLAPKIRGRLAEGGYWSFVGGTTAGYPNLQARSRGRFVRWLCGGQTLAVDAIVCNPSGREEVTHTLEAHGFEVRASETFEPPLHFRDLQEFMDFAYRGGWLTPFIEALGLHRAGLMTRLLLNRFVFPVHDHHSIEIHLARKGTD
jgi:SAM-dependent methyltransferase